jgi:hypothetical protein
MRNASKTGLMIVVILAAALLVGGGLGWWLTRQDTSKTSANPEPAVAKAPANTAPASNEVAAADPQAAPAEPAPDEGLPPQAGVEQKLDAVLLSDADPSVKANRILALMPQATDAEKAELAQHLVNLVSDDNYSATGEMLANPTTPSEVSGILLHDLLNRNNKLKLPMLLAVARVDNHPLKTEAHDMLELFIQEDKGSNWSEWETAINKWLKENEPDEPAAEN